MNTAIIVAAGTGKRFGGFIPKQFIEINGKPVLIHTLERFEKCPDIGEVVLVLASDRMEEFSEKIENSGLTKIKKIVGGGDTRTRSVANGLNEIDAGNAEIVAVHDGARPLVKVSEISKTIEKAKEAGAACLVAEVTDTIKEVSDGKIVGTIDRRILRRALTPQCFRYDILRRAFDENDPDEIFTDECFIVERAGFSIATVEGGAQNIKITHELDLKLAEILLREFEER